MTKLMKGTLPIAFLLALPLTTMAQEREEGEQQEPQEAVEQEVCTATITPVQTGAVLAVPVTFPAPFGTVVAIEAPEESGILLATDEDIERVEMAAEEGEEGEAEKAELTNQPNQSLIWLDTRNATAGTYVITLSNEGGSCQAEITVKDPGEPSDG